jgi:hypothetical protein
MDMNNSSGGGNGGMILIMMMAGLAFCCIASSSACLVAYNKRPEWFSFDDDDEGDTSATTSDSSSETQEENKEEAVGIKLENGHLPTTKVEGGPKLPRFCKYPFQRGHVRWNVNSKPMQPKCCATGTTDWESADCKAEDAFWATENSKPSRIHTIISQGFGSTDPMEQNVPLRYRTCPCAGQPFGTTKVLAFNTKNDVDNDGVGSVLKTRFGNDLSRKTICLAHNLDWNVPLNSQNSHMCNRMLLR